MKIFQSLDEISNIDETVVALGNFDGVHKGHQQIIARTVRSAQAMDLKSAVFTFSNHPSAVIGTVIGKGEPVKNILYAQEKDRIIEEMGIDYLINIPFTKEILQMSPEQFVQEILVEEKNREPGVLTGRTQHNLLVHFEGPEELIGRYVKVRLDTCKGFYYFGTIAGEDN